MKYILRNAAAFLLAPVLLVAGCSGPQETSTYVGYVEAEYVYLAPLQDGRIEALNKREGDRVEPGDIIAMLDAEAQTLSAAQAKARRDEAAARARNLQTGARPEEIAQLEAALEEAKARLAEAKNARDRWLPLVKEDFASRDRGDEVIANYNAAKARVDAAAEAIRVASLGGRTAEQEAALNMAEAADAALAEAQWRLDERAIKAHAPGRIEQVFYRMGERVRAGEPIAAMIPDAGLKVRFFVPQAALPKLSTGASVNVIADGDERPISAVISFIAQEAEFTPPIIYSASSREKLVFMVEARLPATATLSPGLPVNVSAP